VRPSGLIAMSLNEGDYLGWVEYSNGEQDILMVTENGQSIRFHEDEVRVMGRQAGGVNAIKMVAGDRAAGMDVILPDHSHILVVTRGGFGKRTPVDEYSRQSRYGMGIRTLARNQRTGPIVAMSATSEGEEILMITRDGVVLRTTLEDIRETGRSTQGVTLVNLGNGDEVVGLTVLKNKPETADIAASNGKAHSEA
jgi:DNA gyrase subunit A